MAFTAKEIQQIATAALEFLPPVSERQSELERLIAMLRAPVGTTAGRVLVLCDAMAFLLEALRDSDRA